MAPPTSVLSRTLHSITLTKIRELEKQISKYENRKSTILKETNSKDERRAAIAHLLAGVKELYPGADKDDELKNLERWLDQSEYDTSIPEKMLVEFEEMLRGKLEVQSRNLGLADLYSRLLTEWMTPSTSTIDGRSSNGTPEEESFEVLEKQKERLQQLCDKFESVVFEPLETDEVEIDNYMEDLFDSDNGKKLLSNLRDQLASFGDRLLANKNPFTTKSLTWCIKGLLAEDLLSDEKQTILQDFLENKVVLGEIADVLNMRFADIKNWSWEAGEEGIPVMPRQGLNGKYRIWMDEDVLQAIFVHYVGIQWCVGIKPSLMRALQPSSGWKVGSGTSPSQKYIDQRKFYLNSDYYYGGISRERQNNYETIFALSQLPGSTGTLYAEGSYDDDNDTVVSDSGETMKGSSIKQQLLRQIATEVLLHRTFHGEAAVVQSDLQWYATGLSHSTIFAIMRFFGFSEDWIRFYRKVLEAPLNMNPSSDSSSNKPRLRKRGVPMAHAPEKLIGELVLFVMDIVVLKEAGMNLYRLHDDLWLVGEPARCAKAWTAMQTFAKLTGLEFNRHKTGSVYLTTGKQDAKTASIFPIGPICIGFLSLDPKTGDWLIDQKQVDSHVIQLQKQLNACDSVLSWVQTWNSCIGRFFSHTFGEPAFCFGRKHIDSILSTHQRIQRTIFGQNKDGTPKTVTQHLKSMIQTRFGVSDIPDAFLYMPEQLGGLELRNPFVSLFLVRDEIKHNQDELMKLMIEAETKDYLHDKKAFEELSESERRKRFRKIFPDRTLPPSGTPSAILDTFMSFEDYTEHRELTNEMLRSGYAQLMSTPDEEPLQLSPEVQRELDHLQDVLPELRNFSPEKKWIVQLHSKELFDRCGGLSMVEKTFLPLGVLAMIRKKKVTWQMVL